MKKVFYESWIAKYLLGCTSIKEKPPAHHELAADKHKQNKH